MANYKKELVKPSSYNSLPSQVKQWVEANPKSLKKVAITFHQDWGVSVSKETIKRIIKKFNFVWKRMKRGLAKTAAEWELDFKIPKLLELKAQDKREEIDLRYLDESGFSDTPPIPYA